MIRRVASLAAVVQLLGVTPGHAQDRFAILEEPTGTAVGIAVVINAGGAWALPGQAGLAYLAASAILEQLRPRLDAFEARAALACRRASLDITVVAPPDQWAGATTALLDAFLSPAVSDGAFERARSELVARFAVEAGSPAGTARTALDRALFGAGSRWAEPPCGDPDALSTLTAEDARRWARARFTAARTTVAVAGPVDPAAARERVGEALATLARPVALPEPAPPPVGRDIAIREDVVSAWVSLAFPIRGVPRGGPLPEAEALHLLLHHLRETAEPSAANAEVYDFAGYVERYGGGGAVVLHLVTSPDRGAAWASRIREAVGALARGPMPRITFDPLVRRYFGARLLELDSPEARALDAARQLLHDGDYAPYQRRLDQLSPDLLHRAAIRLGDPAVSIVATD